MNRSVPPTSARENAMYEMIAKTASGIPSRIAYQTVSLTRIEEGQANTRYSRRVVRFRGRVAGDGVDFGISSTKPSPRTVLNSGTRSPSSIFRRKRPA
jgi:hypothetical protein